MYSSPHGKLMCYVSATNALFGFPDLRKVSTHSKVEITYFSPHFLNCCISITDPFLRFLPPPPPRSDLHSCIDYLIEKSHRIHRNFVGKPFTIKYRPKKSRKKWRGWFKYFIPYREFKICHIYLTHALFRRESLTSSLRPYFALSLWQLHSSLYDFFLYFAHNVEQKIPRPMA